MADFESDIRIGVDTSQALAAIKNLQREISTFQTTMAKGSAAQAATANKLQQELVSSINSTGKFSATFRNVQTTTESFTGALEKNKLSLGQYFRYAGASTKTFGKMFSNEFNVIEKTSRERVKDLQTQYVKLGRDANGAMKSIAVRPLSLDMENLGTRTAMAAQKQQILNQLLKQGSTNLLNFGKNTQWAGRQLMVGFTVPLTIFGGIAAKTFMELEEQVIKFKKVYGDLFTSDNERASALKDIEALAKSFTKYGIAVSDTIGLAAEAAAAGFGGIDLQRQTEQATRLAILGQLDQQKALETTISIQNAFKLSSDQLAESINFLNAVENQTVVSLDDITTAIPKVAPVIQALGGDVKDLSFFLAAMKEGGVNAAQGANALKSGLASLINPTEKASKFLGGLGINIKGIIEGNIGDLKGTVVEFAQALDTLDPINRARAIEELFGKFQFARLSTLFDNVIGSGSQASRVLDLAANSASELAGIAEAELGVTAASSMNKFKKSVEDLQYALAPIGELFLNIVTPFVEFATSVLDRFNNLDSGVKSFVAGLIGLLGIIGPVALMTFGLLANGLANIIKGFISLKSIFGSAGKASQVLGDQTQYMTQKQLEEVAVAASLEQAHSRLEQQFTSESLAIDKLTAAYTRAIAKQRQFTSPGITTSIAGSASKAKGYAAGGLIRGPGSGTSDSIPAMVSDGEYIVNAKRTEQYLPLLQSIAAGEVPGYASPSGGSPVGKSFSVSRSHAAMPFSQDSPQFQKGIEIAGLQELSKQFPQFIKVVSNLVVELPQKINIALIKGLDQSKFSQAFNASQGKMLSSAKLGGLDISDASNVKAVAEFERQVHDTSLQMADATQDKKVNDQILADATQKVIDQNIKAEGAIGRAAKAFDQAAKQIGQVRVQVPTADVRSGLESGTFTSGKNGSVMFGENQVARESQSTKGKFRPASSYSPAKSYARQALMSFEAGLVAGVNEAAQSKSPSRRAIQAGKNIADGAIQGIEEGVPRAKSQAFKVAGSRRASTDSSVRIGALTNRAPVLGGMPSGAAYDSNSKVLKKNSDLVATSNKSFSGMNANLMQLSFAMSSVGMVSSMMGEDLGGLQSIITGASVALMAFTSIVQIASSMNLKGLAEKGFRGIIDGFKAKSITSKVGVAIASNFKGAAAATGTNKVANVFKNLAGTGSTLFASLSGLTKAFVRFLPFIGIAITAFAAIKIFADIAEEQKQKLVGLGETANLAADKLQYLADITNTQITSQGLSGGFQEAGSSSIDVAQETAAAVKGLKDDSEEFRKVFESNLVAIASSAPAIAESSLASLAIQLNSSGFAPDVIAAIIEMLAKEAKRSDLNLDFLSLNLDGTLDTQKLKEKADESIAIVKEQVDRYNKEVEAAQASTQNLVYGQTSPSATYNVGGGGVSQTAPGPDAGVLQAAMVAGASLGTQMNALNTQLAAGTIDADGFNQELSAIALSFNSIDASVRGVAIDEAANAFGVDFVNAMKGVNSETDKFLLMRAQAAGVDFGIDEIDGLNKANQGSTRIRHKLNRLIAESADNYAEEKRQKELSNQVEVQQVDLAAVQTEIDANNQIIAQAPELVARGMSEADAIDALTDSKFANIFATATQLDLEQGVTTNVEAAIAAYEAYQVSLEGLNAVKARGDLSKQIEQLREQNSVLSWLTANGMSTASALEVIGNSAYYAAAYAALGSKNFAGLNDQLALIKSLEAPLAPRSSGGSAKKSPYQEGLDKLKDQRKDVNDSISAYKKLRSAQLNVADAFDAAQDPIMAAAVATTKVGTDKWSKLVKLIREVGAALKQAKLVEAFTDQKSANALLKSFSKIAPMLSGMGLSLEDINKILGDPTLAQAFVDDLADGVINSQRVLSIINQIPQTKRIQIMFDMATPEGMMSRFDEASDKQTSYLDLQARQIERSFAAAEKSAETNVENAQAALEAVQSGIDGIQASVDDKQRQLELTITRPVEALNDAIAKIERDIELNLERPIAALQESSSDFARELDLMDRAAEEVNNRFDEQAESLDSIVELNADILAQDESRLAIASALSSGNAADVARAMRQARIDEQKRAREKAAKALEVARESELAKIQSVSGMTRAEIERRQLEISDKIYDLEEQREIKQASIQVIQDKIYELELKRVPILASIRTLEDEIFGITNGQLKNAEDILKAAQDEVDVSAKAKAAALAVLDAQKLEWEMLRDQALEAQIQSDGYLTSLDDARKMVDRIKDAWVNVGRESATANSKITGNPSSSGGSTSGSGSGSGGNPPQGPPATSAADNYAAKPPYNPGTGKYWSWTGAKWTVKTIPPKPSTALPAGQYWLFDSTSGKWEKKGKSIAGPVSGSISSGGARIAMATGGMVPKFLASGGFARGTDTVPAMLTPGEFVVRKYAVDSFGAENLKAVNNGTYSGESVYNYSINVNVKSDANPDDIARTVMTQIKRGESQRLRGNNLNG
jgi:TP901 family phage tail tape measure protein